MLRVGILPGITPAKHTILGWQVPDIVAAVKGLEQAGVKFERYPGLAQDDLGIMQFPGGARESPGSRTQMATYSASRN
ncbi:MAG TPA: hypothetical protein VNY30_05480, partial [Bryobacteraceae bacterium]|nr:hypothetical protein [Bryobacteraceae bacterium]